MPKCLLCVLGYAGLGATFVGLDGPEWCGAPPTTPLTLAPTLAAWAGALVLAARAGWSVLHRRRSRA